MSNYELSPFAVWLRKVFAFSPRMKTSFVNDEDHHDPMLPSEEDVRSWIDGSAVPTHFQFSLIVSMLGEKGLGNFLQMFVEENAEGKLTPSQSTPQDISTEEPTVHEQLMQEFQRIMSMPIAQSAPSLTSPKDVFVKSLTLTDHYTAEEAEGHFARVMNLPFPLRVRALDGIHQVIMDATFVHSSSWKIILAELEKVERNYSPERSEEILRRVLVQLKRTLAIEGVK